MSTEQDKLLYAKINLETAQIPWKELERFFDGETDTYFETYQLEEIGTLDSSYGTIHIVAISGILEKKEIQKVTDDQARIWSDSDAMLWAVVVKPWILVQQRRS